MTVATTATQDFDVDELTSLARAKLGVLHAEHLNDEDPAILALGRKLLFLELQALKSDGIVLRWKERYASTLTSGTGYVDAPADTLSIEEGATIRSSDGVTDRPINLYSIEQYQRIPNKTTSGPPVYYAPEQQSDGTWRIYLYPVPDDGYTSITYPRQRRGRDLSNGSHSVDLNPAFYKAVVCYLALCFARHHRMRDAIEDFRNEYRAELERAQGDDTPHGSGFMTIPPTPWD